MNRTSHGLTARRVVLKDENQAEFDELHAQFMQEYSPGTASAMELVQEVASGAWRLRRADRLETEFFDSGKDFSELDKLRRYRTSIERAFHKAIDQLRKLQADAAKQHKQVAGKAANQHKAFNDAMIALINAPLPTDDGFVSQDDETVVDEGEISTE